MRITPFCAAALIGLTSFGGVATAADDGYQDVFSSVLTAVGVMKDEGSPEIEYRERAPLVLPPKMALEKPIEPGAARPASWPQDPDVMKRRRAGEVARAPINALGNSSVMLSKEELLRNRAAVSPSAARRDGCGNNGNQRGCLVVSPDELKADDDRFKAAGIGQTSDEVVAGAESDRLYLTQPPKGYMKTTKTVKATSEAPKSYVDPSNPKADLTYKAPQD